MPNSLVQALKWGGLVLAVITAIALIYVGFVGTGTATEPSSAPTTLYWVLLIIGIIAAVVGVVADRRGTSGGA